MASLNKLIDSLVRQGSRNAKNGQAESGAALPHWISEGAELTYYSHRSQQTLDVIVETISHSKQQVKFVFENNKEVWKSVSFSHIIGGNNTLRQRGKKGATPVKAVDQQTGESADKDPDAFLDELENKFGSSDVRVGRSAGPAFNKLPQAWVKPDVVDIVDDGRTVDIDSSPERAPQPQVPEDPDPYGLEGDTSLVQPARLLADGVDAHLAESRMGRPAINASRDRKANGRRRSRSREAAGTSSKRPAARSRSRSRSRDGAHARRRERIARRSRSARSGGGGSGEEGRPRRRGSDRASPAGKRRRR